MIKAIPKLTKDGSLTLYSELHNAHYHSLNGAIQESKHIFVEAGFNYLKKQSINVFEVGFGTGLNAALTASEALKNKVKTSYIGIDLYPLEQDQLNQLNYEHLLDHNSTLFWKIICQALWNQPMDINDYFSIIKITADFTNYHISTGIDLIYFDAFAPEDQPEMWKPELFEKLFNATNECGILVTYCSKGIVKNALRDAGFRIERLPGPPGKRHIVRALKYNYYSEMHG